MGSRQGRLDAQEFVVAVRERRHGPASEEALQARLALADGYLDADLPNEAIELLVCTVMDASRLYGPSDERTLDTRLRLGDAQVAAGHLYDAYGVHWNLVTDAEAAFGRDAPISVKVRAAAERTERLLEATEQPPE